MKVTAAALKQLFGGNSSSKSDDVQVAGHEILQRALTTPKGHKSPKTEDMQAALKYLSSELAKQDFCLASAGRRNRGIIACKDKVTSEAVSSILLRLNHTVTSYPKLQNKVHALQTVYKFNTAEIEKFANEKVKHIMEEYKEKTLRETESEITKVQSQSIREQKIANELSEVNLAQKRQIEALHRQLEEVKRAAAPALHSVIAYADIAGLPVAADDKDAEITSLRKQLVNARNDTARLRLNLDKLDAELSTVVIEKAELEARIIHLEEGEGGVHNLEAYLSSAYAEIKNLKHKHKVEIEKLKAAHEVALTNKREHSDEAIKRTKVYTDLEKRHEAMLEYQNEQHAIELKKTHAYYEDQRASDLARAKSAAEHKREEYERQEATTARLFDLYNDLSEQIVAKGDVDLATRIALMVVTGRKIYVEGSVIVQDTSVVSTPAPAVLTPVRASSAVKNHVTPVKASKKSQVIADDSDDENDDVFNDALTSPPSSPVRARVSTVLTPTRRALTTSHNSATRNNNNVNSPKKIKALRL